MFPKLVLPVPGWPMIKIFSFIFFWVLWAVLPARVNYLFNVYPSAP